MTSRPDLPRPGAIAAFARRDALNAASYRLAIVLDLTLSALPLVIYFYISKLFGRTPGAALAGAPSFFAFIAVGLSVTTIVQAGTVSLASSLRQEQFTGTLEATSVKPVTSVEMALGIAAYPFAFGMVRALIYLAMAAGLFGADFSEISLPGFVLGFVATGVVLVAIGIAMGAVVLLVKRGEVLSGITVTALVILGGAYFPVTILPAAVEWVTRFVPTRFAFEGIRAALFAGSGWIEPVLKLFAFGAVALPLALLFFDRALSFAKRHGSLAQY